MNRARIKHLANEIRDLRRRLAREHQISLAVLNKLEWGYASQYKAKQGAAKLLERVAANKAGFLTIKAWKHAKEKK